MESGDQRMSDNYSVLRQHEREYERRRSLYPVCECCGRHIEDETLLLVDGAKFHINCFLERHTKFTDDFLP